MACDEPHPFLVFIWEPVWVIRSLFWYPVFWLAPLVWEESCGPYTFAADRELDAAGFALFFICRGRGVQKWRKMSASGQFMPSEEESTPNSHLTNLPCSLYDILISLKSRRLGWICCRIRQELAPREQSGRDVSFVWLISGCCRHVDARAPPLRLWQGPHAAGSCCSRWAALGLITERGSATAWGVLRLSFISLLAWEWRQRQSILFVT